MTHLPPSMEVMAEQFYDACAFLRDLPLDNAPDFVRLSVTLEFETNARYLIPETEEIEEGPVLVWVEIQRFRDGGNLHVHGGGLCVDVDPVALKEKRP